MLPSRGLRWSGQAIGIGRRRINLSSARNFSSTRSIRASPLLPGKSAPFLTANTRLTSSTTTKSILIRNGAGIRFASTTPAAPGIAVSKAPISTATPTPTDTVASSVGSAPTTSFDTAFDSASEFVHESMLDVPEHIGYLKSLGLDYGWGPTGLMEWTLEHVHVLAGTPWWVSITLTALLVRGVLFYPYISAAENGARMSATAHLTRPIMEKSKEAMLAGDEAASQQLRAELLRINKRAGIAYWKSMVPMLQIIPGMGTFFLLKAMANLPVPGLETGGALWFYNLAIPDPYFLLPVMTATVLHWVLRKGGEMGTSPMEPKMMKALMWGMPTLTLLFTWWLPAAVQLSFFVSGVLSYLQSALLRQTWFRSLFDMTPVVPKINTISAAPVSPYQGIMKRAAPSGPLSSTELGSRFEGPKGGLYKTVGHINTLQPPSAIKTILGAPIKGIKEAVGSIKDAGKSTFESAKGAMDKRSQKSAVADRKAYEKKRQTQLKREEREKSSELRAQRAARRALGQKEQ